MPQLDPVYFSIMILIGLFIIYSMVYLYVVWISRSAYEQWLSVCRLRNYFERLFFFVIYSLTIISSNKKNN